MQYSFQTKQIDTLFTAGQKYADTVFQIVNGKSQNVSRNKTTPTYNARHVGFRMFLFSSQNKIDAPKENQCTTRWLLNGFLSLEMFNCFFDPRGRRGGLMVSALVSGSSGPGSSPGRGHCVVFLGKTLYSHRASLHLSV